MVARFVSQPPPAAPAPPIPASLAPSPDTTRMNPVAEDELSTTALLDRVDEMMSQLEERILEELERRGGRFTGYF